MRDTTKTPSYIKVLPGKEGTIVLLHGFLSSKRYWHKVASHLQDQGYQVVMIDLLGFGRAPKPKNISYSYEDHLAHIDSTLDIVNIHEPVTIAGHSMGALLATRYANSYPDKVKAVGLMNPPMYRDSSQAYRTLRNTGMLYRILLESRYRHILWSVFRTINPLSNHSRDSREGSLRNIIVRASLFDDLLSLKKPAILLIGEKDREVYRANIKSMRFGENLDIFLECSGHHAPITHHKSVAHHILRLA